MCMQKWVKVSAVLGERVKGMFNYFYLIFSRQEAIATVSSRPPFQLLSLGETETLPPEQAA